MKKPGRKRSSKNLPAHISAEKLPDGVWFQATGAGHWILNYYDEYHIRKTKKLCGANATLTEIAEVIKRSKSTVSGYVNELQTNGQLHKNGHGWEVLPR